MMKKVIIASALTMSLGVGLAMAAAPSKTMRFILAVNESSAPTVEATNWNQTQHHDLSKDVKNPSYFVTQVPQLTIVIPADHEQYQCAFYSDPNIGWINTNSIQVAVQNQANKPGYVRILQKNFVTKQQVNLKVGDGVNAGTCLETHVNPLGE